MDLFFLAAHVPLTKTFSLQGKSPYPMVKNFTSIRTEIGNINEMFLAISTNARAGHCLLKGPLTRPLVNESRAGSTRSDDPTSWVCLDFDRHEAANIDEELNKLNLGDISYVLQYSASHGMDGTEGTISAHVFMFLEKALPAPSLKNWLMGLNFSHFKDGIHLSRDHNQLVFPLDVTTCQNDKLLYIATPRFLDVEDPMGTQPRISLVEKKLGEIPTERVSELHGNVLDKTKRTVLNALRVAYGLPTRTAKTSFVGAIEIHNKPDQGTVTGIKEDEDWIRLNVNGGDSWAYVHPKENFELVYDHKSGAWYKTKEFLPGYYATLQTQREELNSTPTEDGDLILAFRDLKTAEYYNGLWNPAIKSLELYRAKNETQLDHWMQSHGRTLGAYIPIWDIQYNPREDWIVDADKHRINTFVPSEYMATPGNAKAKFPRIMAIIKHMLGEHNQDNQISDHFLNWLAVIFQRKAKPLTAWVVHGTEGTGKGYFINKIAMPLLGHRNATAVISATIEDQFNGWLEGKLLVYVDEVDVDDFKDKGRVTAKLRNYITEPTMPLRRMRQQSIDVPNYVAFIFSSNRPQPVFIPAGDRRYNVGNFQVSKLDRPNDDEIKAELEAFAAWLNAHEADVPRSNTVLQTDARTLIQKLSLTSIVETCESIKNGDFEALWMARMDERLLQGAPITPHTTTAATYDLLLKRLIAEGYPEVLTRDEMQIILQYNVGNMPTSPNKFTALLRHNGIETKWVRKHGQKTYGIHVKWVKLKKEDLK